MYEKNVRYKCSRRINLNRPPHRNRTPLRKSEVVWESWEDVEDDFPMTPEDYKIFVKAFGCESEKHKPKITIAPAIKTNNPRRENESHHWQSLLHRKKFIRAIVKDLIDGRQTGFYLSGRGGTGKSWFVKEVLEELAPDRWCHETGTTTPAAFFQTLETNCKIRRIRQPKCDVEEDAGENKHLIFDDISTILADKKTRDVLLSILDKDKRMASWKINKDVHEIEMKTGIGIISNIELKPKDNPVLAALLTRIKPLDFDPTEPEIWAQIYRIADNHPLGGAALEVADYLYDVCKKHHKLIDIRLYSYHAIPNYESWKADKNPELDWKERTLADVLGQPTEYVNPKDVKSENVKIACESCIGFPEQFAKFNELQTAANLDPLSDKQFYAIRAKAGYNRKYPT